MPSGYGGKISVGEPHKHFMTLVSLATFSAIIVAPPHIFATEAVLRRTADSPARPLFKLSDRIAKGGVAKQPREPSVSDHSKPATDYHLEPATTLFVGVVVSCSKSPLAGREGALAQETTWVWVVHSFR